MGRLLYYSIFVIIELIEFDLNHYILIQITDHGWDCLKKSLIEPEEYIKHCILPHKVEHKGEEWFKLQTHNVMNLFGRFMIGNPSPIKLLIYFEI